MSADRPLSKSQRDELRRMADRDDDLGSIARAWLEISEDADAEDS